MDIMSYSLGFESIISVFGGSVSIKVYKVGGVNTSFSRGQLNNKLAI